MIPPTPDLNGSLMAHRKYKPRTEPKIAKEEPPTAEELQQSDEYLRQLDELDYTDVRAIMPYIIDVSTANAKGRIPLHVEKTLQKFEKHGFQPSMSLDGVDLSDGGSRAAFLIGVFLQNLQDGSKVSSLTEYWMREWKEDFGTGSES